MKNITEIANAYQEARKNKLTEHKAFLNIKEDLDEIYDESGISELADTMIKLTDICCIKVKDAEVFGKGFFGIIAGGGDSFGDEEVLLFERLTERFPGSAKLAEMLADVYGVIVDETQNEEYAEKLEILSKNNPALANAALQQVYALSGYHHKKDLNEYSKAVEKIREIYERYNQLNFAEQYSDSLNKLLYKQDEEDARETLLLLEGLLNEWKSSFMANHYLDALSKFTWTQDEKGCKETILLMETFWDVEPFKNDTIAMHLAYTLANYCACDLTSEEKSSVINRLKELSVYWEPAQRIASEIQSEGIYQYAHKPAKAK